VRQCCNVAYSFLAEGRDDEQLDELDAKIGMIEDPAEVAMGMLRAHQEAIGAEVPGPEMPSW